MQINSKNCGGPQVQNKCFFSKQLFVCSEHFALSSKQITLFSKQMFHFKTYVSFQNKCLVFKTNVKF